MCHYDADNDAVHLARVDTIVKREMFKNINQFNGSLDAKCQAESVPPSLLALVAMIIYGPNIEVHG